MSEFGPQNMPTDTLTLRQPVESERVLLERGQSVVFSPESPIDVDIETKTNVVGKIELPGTVDSLQNGEANADSEIRIVHRSDVGYLVCPPGAKIINGLPETSDWTKYTDQIPLTVGSNPGDKLVIGRRGVVYSKDEQVVLSLDMDQTHLTDSISPLINPYVSGQHVAFEVGQDGQLQVTDLSSNGTAVTVPK